MYIPLNWQIDRVLPIGVFDFPLVSASNEQFLPLFLLAINEPSDSTLQSNLMFPIFIIEPYYFHVIPRSSHVPLVQRERKRNVSNGTELDSFSNVPTWNFEGGSFRFDLIRAMRKLDDMQHRYFPPPIPKRTASSRNGGNFRFDAV